GIAAVYVGPADLAISMGFKPGSDDPAFLAALDLIVARSDAHGVVPGIHATPVTAADRLTRGFRMVTVTTDLVALRTRLAEDVSQVRAGLADHITRS
ncbi:MAG: 2,4-dihydroxyhept-2-ene-1,7-dioic acid aldolase, partial [Acidimicrobiia bacterium]|nr:2,4-dihydroxyhept-2-ene-1,7-dioic acid aldolase [Acidimicrobiia bacterium]